ncbi:kelch-like protein 17 isoform X3 [Bacillus rossius redtenbacheri]|uniref:kelch-like protein 17 isoform X3 n=1 Tax=Bacillus rossius redtenbacheri TaxID=93214 RepID=UPI002FDECC81
MDLEDSFLDEDSEASYSDEDSLKSENSHDLYDEDASKRDSSSEGQAEMEDEDVLWNPKDIKMKDVPDDKPNIKDMIKKYITDPKNADCVVSVRGKEFRCHKLLLQCYSDHFKNCDSNYVELNFPSLTPDMFSELYSWMYGSPFSYKRILHPRTILDVLISAVDLGVRELEEQCWAVFNSKDVFNEETAYSMFLEAKLKSCDMVADIMLPRISKFFKHLAASDDFLKLPARHAADLLDSAHVSVPAEAHVLVAALRWLAHDWDARRQHAAAIMGCVRFQRMSPLELVVVRRSRRSATLQRLMELPEMARGAPALPPGQLADLLDQLGLQRPKPRHYSSPAGDHDSVSELLEDLVQLGSSAPSSLTALSCSTVLRR